MKTSNKGFTLVELMVCVVIFAVVLSAAFGFMLAAAKSYTKVNDRLEIQRQSQSALSLVEEYIVDCNVAIAYNSQQGPLSNDTLYIVDSSDGGYVVNVFRFDPDGTLYYSESEATAVTDENTGEISSFTFTEKKGYKVTKNVESFSVETVSENEAVSLAEITLGMKKGSAAYECTAKIALRNVPALFTASDGALTPAPKKTAEATN